MQVMLNEKELEEKYNGLDRKTLCMMIEDLKNAKMVVELGSVTNEEIEKLQELMNNERNNLVVANDDGWIKCSDRLPKHEEIVDIYTCTEEGQKRITDCMYCDYEEDKGKCKHFYDERYDYIYTLRHVSHWMPKPEEPIE